MPRAFVSSGRIRIMRHLFPPIMRKHLGHAEQIAVTEGPTNSAVHPVSPQATDDRRMELWNKYLDLLASEDDDPVTPKRYPILAQAREILDAASRRPQTSTIMRLTASFRSLDPQQDSQQAEQALAALKKEIEKPDSVLWAEIESDDDDVWQKIGTTFDSVYG
jgi:hypothetical protein